MNQQQFIATYNESRNGCNERFRHPLARRLVYSDGVGELAEIGCYWLLDIIGSEHAHHFLANQGVFDGMAFIYVRVANGKAVIELARDSDVPAAYTRKVDLTDMPDGVWTFYLSLDQDEKGNAFAFLYLPSEY